MSCLAARMRNPPPLEESKKSPLEKFLYNNCPCHFSTVHGGVCDPNTPKGREIVKLCILAAQAEVPDFAKFMAQAVPLETGILSELEKEAEEPNKAFWLHRKCPAVPDRICLDIPTEDCLTFTEGCAEREALLSKLRELKK